MDRARAANTRPLRPCTLRQDDHYEGFARIHKNNLINHGVIPAVFADPSDYDKIDQEDELSIENLRESLKNREFIVTDETKGFTFKARLEVSDLEADILLAGGKLRYTKKRLAEA